MKKYPKVWLKLPKSMANYTNKYFEEYVPEDSLKEAILCQNLVSDNLENLLM